MTDLVVRALATPSLGDRSYLIHDGATGVVIDPQRDIDRILELIEADGVEVTHVFETHIHNDYVSGGLALARRLGATYAVPAGSGVTFDCRSLEPDEELATGRLRIRAVATPGHTFDHMSYVASDAEGPIAVFTGGSVLYGSVGRTDLVGADHTETLTRAQYRSALELLEGLPPEVAVYPTHGFGSFCSSGGLADRDEGTIADERRDNIVVRAGSTDAFVEQILAGLDDYPAYYAHIAPLNQSGAFAPRLDPPVEVDPDELRRRLDAGEWVVDLRQRVAFARDHVERTVSVELGDSLATYLGWLLPWGSGLTLIGASADDVAEAQRHLSRIGIDQIAGSRHGDLDEIARHLPRGAYDVSSFAGLAARFAAGEVPAVVDVRSRSEWAQGHIAGAHNVPLHQLADHLHHVPAGELWVHCESGLRASIGASLLARANYDVVLIDDAWDAAAAAGLPLSDL